MFGDKETVWCGDKRQEDLEPANGGMRDTWRIAASVTRPSELGECAPKLQTGEIRREDARPMTPRRR